VAYFIQVIAVYNYQNSEEVWRRFKIVYDDIRYELDLAAVEYFKQGGKPVDLGSCWIAFFEKEKNAIVKLGNDFVLKGIQDLAARWVEDPSKDDK
jgi:hypothetical protein